MAKKDRPQTDEIQDENALERMNKALKAALETPPKPHKDEPKRRSSDTPRKKS